MKRGRRADECGEGSDDQCVAVRLLEVRGPVLQGPQDSVDVDVDDPLECRGIDLRGDLGQQVGLEADQCDLAAAFDETECDAAPMPRAAPVTRATLPVNVEDMPVL